MSDNVALAWNQVALEAVRQTRTGPPIVARALHVLHASMYDAWAVHDGVAAGYRLGDLVRRPEAARAPDAKREAVSFAAHRALSDLFPTEATRFAKLMSDLGYDPDAPGSAGSPGAVGVQAARTVLAFRHGDGANQLGDMGPEPRGLAAAYADWTGYRPANDLMRLADPNRWQPLPTPDGLGQRFLAPHWGLVAPFALRAGWELRPDGPRRHPGRSFLLQATELLADSAGLTDERKAIAEYWADGPASETPPGHWCLLARQVSVRDGHGLDEDVRLFFALAGALLDASIACWDAKRTYDSVRPVTAIHFLFDGQEVSAWAGPGQGTRRIPGETWQPYLATPPFAEYPSGHSTFSAAAATVLAGFTGSDRFGAGVTVPAGSSRVEHGVPAADVVLSWPTFSAAAEQAGRSRRYGGIHFPDGDLSGRDLGAAVGARAWAVAGLLFSGRRPAGGARLRVRPPGRRRGRRAGRRGRPRPGPAPGPTGIWSACS